MMKISRTHFYEKHELINIVNAVNWTPLESIGEEIKEWIKIENRGEYLINIIDDYSIRRLQEYLIGD